MGSNYFEFFKSPSMENNFGIQHHDDFYFGAPPTDFAVLGASSSPEFQYETPMTGNPNFGRALASDFGASMADFGAYATDLGVSPGNFESPPLIQPMSSDFPPPMSYHYEAPPPMSTNYGGQPINDWSEQSFMSSQGESLYQDSFYRNPNFGVHHHNSSNFGVPQQSNSDFSFPYSRTVLVKIHSELYPISREVLDWVFSGIGNLESIECFDQYRPFHSRIYFQDRDSAVRAVYWLDGSCIYKGCCRVELILEAELIDRINEMDASNQQILEDSRIYEPVKQSSEFEIVDEWQDCWVTTLREEMEDSIKDVRQEMDSSPEIVDDSVMQEVPCEFSNRNQRLNFAIVDETQAFHKGIEAQSDEINEDPKELQIKFESPKVISHIPISSEVEVTSKRMGESVKDSTDSNFK